MWSIAARLVGPDGVAVRRKRGCAGGGRQARLAEMQVRSVKQPPPARAIVIELNLEARNGLKHWRHLNQIATDPRFYRSLPAVAVPESLFW